LVAKLKSEQFVAAVEKAIDEAKESDTKTPDPSGTRKGDRLLYCERNAGTRERGKSFVDTPSPATIA
jgi:hypothetical protein